MPARDRAFPVVEHGDERHSHVKARDEFLEERIEVLQAARLRHRQRRSSQGLRYRRPGLAIGCRRDRRR